MKNDNNLLFAILGGVVTCFIFVGMVFLFPTKGTKMLTNIDNSLVEIQNDDLYLGDNDELIRQFLDHIEVLDNEEDKDVISLRIVLNTGKDFSISFNNKKHPFCTSDTYDKS